MWQGRERKRRCRAFRRICLMLCMTILLGILTGPGGSAAADDVREKLSKSGTRQSLGGQTEAESPYYRSESGVYSFCMEPDGRCYWYQNGLRFAGSYETTTDGFRLRMLGSSHYSDTVFSALREGNALRVNGGTVQGELFLPAEKPEDVRALDREAAAGSRDSGEVSHGTVSLTPTLLLDESGLSAWAVGYSADEKNSEVVLIELENNSAETVTFTTESVVINGEPLSTTIFEELAPGGSTRCELYLEGELMGLLGIETIESFILELSAENEDGSFRVKGAPTSVSLRDERTRVFHAVRLDRKVLSERALELKLLGYLVDSGLVKLYYTLDNAGDCGLWLHGNEGQINGENVVASITELTNGRGRLSSEALLLGMGDFGSLESAALRLEVKTWPGFDELCPMSWFRMCFDPDGLLYRMENELVIDTGSEAWRQYFAQAEIETGGAAPSGGAGSAGGTAGEERVFYVVKMEDFDPLVAGERFGFRTISMDFYQNGSDLASFLFEQPIENCSRLRVPITITAVEGSDLSDVSWSTVWREAGTENWYFGEAYSYTDGQAGNALVMLDVPTAIDGISVIPVEAPNGWGPFSIRITLNEIMVGFSDEESASRFVDSLPESKP